MNVPALATTDWDLLLTFLPDGWREKARELGAIKRQPRKVTSVEDTLRMLLIHLAEDCSLRETVVRAEQGGLPSISSVALFKRLRASEHWLAWIGKELLQRQYPVASAPGWLKPYRVCCVDASVINQPGSKGTDWRLHYALDLYSLRCIDFQVTNQSVGESFRNFAVQDGDLFVGDRAYGRLTGMRWVEDHGGDYVVRLKHRSFDVYTSSGEKQSLPDLLSSLKIGETWDKILHTGGRNETPKPIRICALRKSDIAAKEAQEAYRKTQSKKQRPVKEDTLEMHRYIVLATSLPASISAEQVLNLYRRRWQVELAFKRLKGILELGQLPKSDPRSCRAWLHGKMLVALLIEAILDETRRFSPWGYPYPPAS